MKDLGNGMYECDSDSEDACKERLTSIVESLVDGERARLTAKMPELSWWADAAFVVHDLNGVADVLKYTGQADLAQMLDEIVDTVGKSLMLHFCDGNKEKADALLEELGLDAQMLDEVVEKRFHETNGGLEQ